MAFVDIIIPIYNSKQYLRKCIKSVLEQSFKDYKIILVDDGSTDGSQLICNEYGQKYKNILVIHKENSGLSSAKNEGLKRSSSQYIMFLDSDDYLSKDALNYAYKVSKINNYPDLLIFDIFEENEDKSFINEHRTKLTNQIVSKKDYQEMLLSDYVYVTSWSKLYKRKLFDNNNFKVKKYREDEFIIHHLIENVENKIFIFSYKLYHYVRHKNSIMASQNYIKDFDYLDALLDRINFFVKHNYLIAAQKTFYYAINLFFDFSRHYKKNKQIIKFYKNQIIKNQFCKNKIMYSFLKMKYYFKKIKNKIKIKNHGK